MQAKINWFEIPATDLDRAAKFYEAVFDTKLRRENFSEENKMAIFSGADGNSIGCVVKGEHFSPAKDGVVLYFDAGASIDRTLARVEPAGGKVQKEKIELPQGIGFIAYFIDTEGNRVAMHGAA